MIRRTALPTVLFLLGVTVLAGCGGSDEPTAADSPASTPTVTTSAPAPKPTPTRTPKPTPKPTPTSDQNGDGDDVDDGNPPLSGGGVCTRLIDPLVSAEAGTAVHGTGFSGRPGCIFTGAQGLAITFIDQPEMDAGGMAGAKNEATSGVEGEPQDLTGIGDAAFVVTGTMFGGVEPQGAGAVLVGDRIISVSFEHKSRLTAAQVRAKTVKMLKLVAGLAQ